MTQDQHSAEWMKEAERLADDYAFDSLSQFRMKKRAALLAHLQQRPLPVREGTVAWMHEFTDPFSGERTQQPRKNKPSDFELQPGDVVFPLFASSPSVQNMGEGETGKDGVDVPLAPSTKPMPFDAAAVETLAHRIAWRYKKSTDPHHSDTYTFNKDTLLQFARGVLDTHGVNPSDGSGTDAA